jgi:hypothetical protein
VEWEIVFHFLGNNGARRSSARVESDDRPEGHFCSQPEVLVLLAGFTLREDSLSHILSFKLAIWVTQQR